MPSRRISCSNQQKSCLVYNLNLKALKVIALISTIRKYSQIKVVFIENGTSCKRPRILRKRSCQICVRKASNSLVLRVSVAGRLWF